jgi:hypothetical protein
MAEHQIVTEIAYNTDMGDWDIHLYWGNFENEEEALRHCEAIKEWMEENAGAVMMRPQ